MHVSWLLFWHSGKSNRNRLALTAAAIAVGVLMMLVFVAGVNALLSRSQHTSWRLNFYNNQTAAKPIEGVSPLMVSLAFDGNLNKYQNTTINVVAMHATGPTSPYLPNLPTPKAGEYYVSPALQKIIQEHPGEAIGARFGDRQIGIIPDRYVSSPDSLDVVRGMSGEEAAASQASSVYRITGASGVSAYSGMTAILLFIGAAILFIPVIIFVAIATQLGSVQREQRYAALRLIGATRRQILQILLLESLAAAVIGVAIGSVLFAGVRVLLAGFYFDGMRFWPGDIALTAGHYLGIVGVVLLLCVTANWWGMRRVQVSPLGVVRRQVRAKRPRFIQLVPLLIGIGIYVWAATAGKTWIAAKSAETSAPLLPLLLGIALVMFGLLFAGPYITRLLSAGIAKKTRNASTLIATRRIETQFKPVFRSVSGVVLALFAGSFYLTAVSGIADYTQKAVRNNGYSQLKPNTALITGESLPQGLDKRLAQLEYVASVEIAPAVADASSAIPCSTVTRYTKLSCESDSGYAIINFNAPVADAPHVTQTLKPVGAPAYLVALSSNDAIDRLRSFVAAQVPNALSATGGTYVISGTYAQEAIVNPLIKEFAGLAYVGIGVTLFIAIASLVVSTVGGLLERRRSFATLRLGGMNVGQMKRTVIIESLIPLLSTSFLSAGIGCWIGSVFIAALGSSLQVKLQLSYFVVVGGAFVAAALAIYTVLPLIDKMTRPEANQTE